MRFSILAIILSIATAATAKPPSKGEVLYLKYCGACHAPDGQGAGNGAFPPLAGSEWLIGNPKRTVAIILHGLKGPIEVRGKSYNLAMPPHKDSLSDDQISRIVNHIHTSWGNRGEKIRRDMPRTVRAEFPDRNTPWTGSELLKKYPIPRQESPLKNLLSYTYSGSQSAAPDFANSKPLNVEEEHDGFLKLSIAGREKGFGLVWEGDFETPADGKYEFYLNADDGARLLINQKEILNLREGNVESSSGALQARLRLKKGSNKFRLEYYQLAADKGLVVGWKRQGQPNWQWISEQAPKKQKPYPDIILAPEDNKAAIYRNFIEGTTPRGIGIGFPGGLNLAYSADRMGPDLIWTGKFINAGRHWTARGQGNQDPESNKITRLAYPNYLPTGSKFAGYDLDEFSNPTFRIKLKKGLLLDAWKASPDGFLTRTLSLQGYDGKLNVPTGLLKVGTVIVSAEKPTTIEYKLSE